MIVSECISCAGHESVSYGSSAAFSELAGNKNFTQEAYSILKCKNCGLYYKDHMLDEHLFTVYYNSFDFKAWEPTENYPTEDVVEKYLVSLPGKKILDYGCSEGRFISKFITRHQCYGYDIDQRALKLAQQKGIKVFDHEAISRVTEKFDVIILSDVFEHSTEPTKLISFLLSMLEQSGTLIITTGFADAKACQYDLPHFWYFRTVQHVCMIGDDYIRYLENNLGVKVVKKIRCSHYKASFNKKLFYRVRFNLFKFIQSNKDSFMVNMISRIPVLKKITRWKELPYYPYSKDHVVLFLQKKGT